MERMDITVDFREKDVRDLIARYHFEPNDARMIQTLVHAVLPLVSAHAFITEKTGSNRMHMPERDAANPADDGETLACLVTLGYAFDKFQDVYSEHGCLSESYMLDCIGLELLMKAYKEVVRLVQQDKGCFVKQLIFPGDEPVPMSVVREIYEGIAAEADASDIICNEQYQLSPKKSTALLLPLTKRRVEQNVCEICTNCGNRDCILKKQKASSKKNVQIKMPDNTYSYGYQRIFGKEK